jgi:hypothetical protein
VTTVAFYPAGGKLPSRITKTFGLKLPWISLWQREEDVSHGSLVIAAMALMPTGNI